MISSETSTAITFSSLSILLLAFLILLNSYAKPNELKKAAVLDSLEKRFINTKASADGAENTFPIGLIDKLKRSDALQASLVNGLRELGYEWELGRDNISILIPNDEVFLVNAPDISAASLKKLRSLAAVIKDSEAELTVTVHQKSLKDSKSKIESLQLSSLRAASFFRLMLDSKIDAQKISTVGEIFSQQSKDLDNTTELLLK